MRRANNNKRSGRPRRGTRQKRESTTSKIQTNHIAQPLPVGTDLVTMRRFEVIATNTGTGNFSVSCKNLVDTIPGGVTVWDKIQFHKFDVFANQEILGTGDNEYANVAVTLMNPASADFGDIPTGYADSVGMTRRAHVGITPNKLFREAWFDSADDSPLLVLTKNALVQFVATLRSTSGAIAPSNLGRVEPPHPSNR